MPDFNQASQKRLIQAIHDDDLEAARQALLRGANPGEDANDKGAPAFHLVANAGKMGQGVAMLKLFLEHGLSPNLTNPSGFGRPLRYDRDVPLLFALLRTKRGSTDLQAPSASDAMAMALLNAGADPYMMRIDRSGAHTLWSVAAGMHRLPVLKALNTMVSVAWQPDATMEHPLTEALKKNREHSLSLESEAVGEWLLQRFPTVHEHRHRGATPVMRLHNAHQHAAVAWMVEHGASTVDRWENTKTEEDDQSSLPHGRIFSVWPSAVNMAIEEGTEHPFFQRCLHDPALRAVINAPFFLKDLFNYGNQEGSTSLLGFALHHLSMDGHQRTVTRWTQTINALVDIGAEDALGNEDLTTAQRWAHAGNLDGGELLDDHPGWEAPHRKTGRTPLFEVQAAYSADFWIKRGHRMDHVDMMGDQAFTNILVTAVEADTPDLAKWCMQRWADGSAPVEGRAKGRSMGDWVVARVDLLGAYGKALTARGMSAQPSMLALHTACDKLKFSTLKKLVAQPSIVDTINHVDAEGLTPLMRLMIAPATTSTQLAHQREALALLIETGARTDTMAHVSFDAAPSRARKERYNQEAAPGLWTTTWGTAAHILAVRWLDGYDASSMEQRYAAMRLLLQDPRSREVKAWSTHISDAVAHMLLEACDAQENKEAFGLPSLKTVWHSLGLNEVAPAIVDDLLMAFLDPRRLLSVEHGFSDSPQQQVKQRYEPQRFNERVREVVNAGATAFSTGLDGRTTLDAMLEWEQGRHAPKHPVASTISSQATTVAIKEVYQKQVLAHWGPWVVSAYEARALHDTWAVAQAKNNSIDALPVTPPRRRL